MRNGGTRSADEIHHEIHETREDLLNRLGALEHIVRETVDVKARARVAYARGRIQVEDLANRALAYARANPGVIRAVVGVVVGALLLRMAVRRHYALPDSVSN